MITEKHKPKYHGWSHDEIIRHQRKKLRDVIRGSSRSIDLNLDEPPDREITEGIRAYTRGWEVESGIEEEPDERDSVKPTGNELETYETALADKLEAYETELNIHVSVAGGGSSVNLATR